MLMPATDQLIAADDARVTVIDRERLATMIMDASLTGWLIKAR